MKRKESDTGEPDRDECEPDGVDAVEVPNPVDLGVQGGGLRAARARSLEAERRAVWLRWLRRNGAQ